MQARPSSVMDGQLRSCRIFSHSVSRLVDLSQFLGSFGMAKCV